MSAKTNLPNPKDLIGITKVPTLSVVPSTALIHIGRALQDGASKYGATNWRDHPVQASIYVDAAMRHLMAWWDGEEIAEDSGVHHLGHAMACFAILTDSEACGNLIDDRPKAGPAPRLLKAFQKTNTPTPSTASQRPATPQGVRVNTGTKPSRPPHRRGSDGLWALAERVRE